MSRHAWDHPAPHRYVCRLCGLEKWHRAELQPGGRSLWRIEFRHGADLIGVGHTPPCPGIPLPELVWVRVSPYAWDAATGHRISVTRHAGALRYSAWGPDQAPGEYGPKHAPMHYARGAAMPTRRAWLGAFPSPELARQACARDATPIATETPPCMTVAGYDAEGGS